MRKFKITRRQSDVFLINLSFSFLELALLFTLVFENILVDTLIKLDKEESNQNDRIELNVQLDKAPRDWKVFRDKVRSRTQYARISNYMKFALSGNPNESADEKKRLRKSRQDTDVHIAFPIPNTKYSGLFSSFAQRWRKLKRLRYSKT